MSKYTVAILGLGAIFSRHLEAIKSNAENYRMVGVYDTDRAKLSGVSGELGVKAYEDEDAVYQDKNVNCVVILTPSNKHYQQMLKAIDAGKHVIVEKPATFLLSELDCVAKLADEANIDVFTVLQVRLNPSIVAVKQFIRDGFMGNLRGVSLIQRWQRPLEYFSGWRGTMAEGGGVLREFGIHYLDALMNLVGTPKKINSASFYNTKFTDSDVYDTVYANLDFGSFGGNIEISIGAEPKNIECSLSIMSDYGFIKLGGKSLDVILEAQFLDPELVARLGVYYERAVAESRVALASSGASPYHPELYRQIIEEPAAFKLGVTRDVIELVEGIYQFQAKS